MSNIPKEAKAAVLVGYNEPFEIRTYPVTKPKAGSALVELIASGICGTDIHIHRGKLGIVPPKVIGHEFIGKVVDIAEDDAKKCNINVGDNVIISIACPCGECLLCKNGDDANCVNMGVTNGGDPEELPHFHGGFCEYTYAPIQNMVKLDESLDPRVPAIFPCPGPTAIHAFKLAEQANCHIEKATTAVVMGLGPVGTFALIYLASLGIKNIIAITKGKNDQREQMAADFGATKVFNTDVVSEDDVKQYVLDITGGLGADVVFEASGAPSAVPFEMDLLRNRGVYLVPGQYSASGGIEIQPQVITFKALHIIGSSQYSMCDVKSYIDFLIANPQLHEKMLALGTFYKVEDINKAYEDIAKGLNVKSVLVK
ncbi:MAG: hypothetical protein E7491_00915 [Ruminococcaceae bacterium]|nr:hypothetical protein [Oscillospiraceae bacterium]